MSLINSQLQFHALVWAGALHAENRIQASFFLSLSLFLNESYLLLALCNAVFSLYLASSGGLSAPFCAISTVVEHALMHCPASIQLRRIHAGENQIPIALSGVS